MAPYGSPDLLESHYRVKLNKKTVYIAAGPSKVRPTHFFDSSFAGKPIKSQFGAIRLLRYRIYGSRLCRTTGSHYVDDNYVFSILIR